MAVNHRLLRLLVTTRLEYELLPHREAFTAQEIAQTSHVAGGRLAKVVLVRTGPGRYLMAALPASCHLDLDILARRSAEGHVVLASEREIQRLFPDCEVGAMPPFGNLYDLPLYLDPCLLEHDDIVFQAGNHHELIRMDVKDYECIAAPFVAVGCLHAAPVVVRR